MTDLDFDRGESLVATLLLVAILGALAGMLAGSIGAVAFMLTLN